MAGTKNDVLVGKNADFTQINAPNALSAESNGLFTNAQLWIGSTALNAGGTHINVGTITSPNGSITYGYSSPNITSQVNITNAFPWIDQGVNTTLAVRTGYFVTAATTQTLAASPAQGDIIAIDCDTTGTVVVTANAGQTIRIGNTASSVAGTATSSAQGDALYLVFRASNNTWQAINSTGGWVLA